MDIRERKRALRSEIRARERQMPPEAKQAADREIIRRLTETEEYKTAETVFAFVGTKREIDTRALLEDIMAAGKTLCVPLCTGDGSMELRRISSFTELSEGAYGILEPAASSAVIAESGVDLAVVPCVSCSHSGKRLGQGGGFYDRFMERYKGKAILICREELTREDIPAEAHDFQFRTVITDAGIYRTRHNIVYIT